MTSQRFITQMHPLWQRVVAAILVPAQLFMVVSPTLAAASSPPVAGSSLPAAITGLRPPSDLLNQNTPAAPARAPKRTSLEQVRRRESVAREKTRGLQLPTEVTDAQLKSFQGFREPLVRCEGAVLPRENAALSAALNRWQSGEKINDFSPLEHFLRTYPASGWAPSLRLNLAGSYYDLGLFSQALSAWEITWEQTKSMKSPAAVDVADQALAHLAVMNARVGRMGTVETLVKIAETRSPRSNLQPLLRRAQDGLWMMQNKPGVSFRCGPYALNLIHAKKSGSTPDAFLADIASPPTGFSLSEISSMATAKLNMPMQMAKRQPGASLIVPAVVHWKLDHYAAILEESNGSYFIKDPTFGNDTWMSAQTIDTEGSGFFLVPAGPLPKGWTSVSETDGSQIFGKGHSAAADPNETRDDSHKQGGDCGDKGMASYQFHTLLAGLTVSDIPLGYSPPYGPAVNLRLAYNQREYGQPTTMLYSNLGPQWVSNWLSFIEELPRTLPAGGNLPPLLFIDVEISLPAGGIEKHSDAAIKLGDFHRRGSVWLRRVTNGYERITADGSKLVYTYAIGAEGTRRKIFLTQSVTSTGHALNFLYDTTAGLESRLIAVVDATGLTTTLHYNNPAAPFLITAVEDPYGRTAQLFYQESGGVTRLTTIRDVVGIESSFEYNSTGFLTTLITPYGRTVFQTEPLNNTSNIKRWIQATDPQGGTERLEYAVSTYVAPIDPTDVPAGLLTSTGDYDDRNSFYWSKKAYAEGKGNVAYAHLYHWAQIDGADFAAGILERERPPLESSIWYNYPGQTNSMNIGSRATVSALGRIVTNAEGNPAPQIYTTEQNIIGHPTKSTDPLGRQIAYDYALNGVDLTAIRIKSTAEDIAPGFPGITPPIVIGAGFAARGFQTASGGGVVPIGPNGPTVKVAEFTYNSSHQILTSTDAAGQITTLTYNSAGQVSTITNPKNETTRFYYHPTGQSPEFGGLAPATAGYLVLVDGPLSGSQDQTRITYDGYGRPRTFTESTGYTVTMEYDLLDRPTKVTYPDGTYEQVLYVKMSPEWSRDRRGRWTQTLHDSLRRPTVVIDAADRKTLYDWCSCGSLSAIVDPAGNRTSWIRDAKGRVTSKIYPDNTLLSFGYDPRLDLLKTTTDATARRTNYAYNVDGTLSKIDYTDSAGAPLVPATPGVAYAYDIYYTRVLSMTDGLGTTLYDYKPYAAYTAPTGLPDNAPSPPITPNPGAGQLASIDGPWVNDTITLVYDQLGRQVSRSINGTANQSSVTFDGLGRVQSQTNPLGVFGYAYVGATGRLDRINYPNGQRTTYAYFDTLGDQRLKQIKNLAVGGESTLSQFDYTYDAIGQITSWTQHHSGAPSPQRYDLRYDGVDQLVGAILKKAADNTVLKEHAYGYDNAGNRVQEQLDRALTASQHNAINQLTNQTSGGEMEFAGTVTEPANVTLGGKSATVDPAGNWRGRATVAPGNNSIPLVATDLNGNITTKTIAVTVAGGAPRTLVYDLNGNLVDDGAGKTYGWDALNRLVKITQGTNVTEFVYNGSGERVQEKLNGAVIKQWIWCGGPQPCEERDASNNITKRFYAGLGEQIGGVSYFYSTDHLGTIREMTDSSGAIRAQYSYDPYGRITKVSGDLEADFGFTGHYRLQRSELNLTQFRTYTPELGRWLSRDPVGEVEGINLYRYVSNDPVANSDPTGLAEWHHIVGRNGPAANLVRSFGSSPHDANYGRMFNNWGDHRGAGNMGTHGKWLSDVNKWARQNPAASERSFVNFLTRLKDSNPSYSNWLSRSTPATKSYWAYRNSGSARIGTLAGIVGVGSLAIHSKQTACNLINDALNIKNGVIGAEIDLYEHMQDLAPGFAGHMAFLIAYGNM